jgi:dienelactone hydrolase
MNFDVLLLPNRLPKAKQMIMNMFSAVLAIALVISAPMAWAQEKLNKWVEKIYTVERPAPTIIIGHGCGGFGDHEHGWARQIQSWGYNAVILDSFKPRGAFNGTCNKTIVMPGDRVHDVYEIAEALEKQSFHAGKIGYVGFSHGGSLALHLANDEDNRRISASVAYYPGCHKWAMSKKGLFGERRSFSAPRIPAAMMLAEKDDWTPIKPCLEFVKDSNYQVQTYPNATHGFDMNLPRRQAYGWTLWYDQEADADSRKKTREFFDSNLR